MKCPPRTHQLYALREQRFSWLACLAELIDNALDAGAQRIDFGWPTRTAFEIRDDGHGIPPGRMDRLFTLGEHVPNAGVKRRSGQFGIGFKHAVGANVDSSAGEMATSVLSWVQS
jgi:signal transduction histidine kinase